MAAPKLKRSMYHAKPKGPTEGLDVRIAKFACRRYEDGLMPEGGWATDTEHFGPALYNALHKVIQPREGIQPSGDIGQATWDVLWLYLDDYRRRRYRLWKVPSVPKPNPVPDLGPLYVGGASVLNHQLTHATDGIAGYPAYDDGWVLGRSVLAVEDLIVTEASSATYGDAFYASGKSLLQYWYGHLKVAPAVGRTFKKGEVLGTIGWQPTPHVHLGINATPLIGHSLLYGSNGDGPPYTYGSPTVGTQLKEWLSL